MPTIEDLLKTLQRRDEDIKKENNSKLPNTKATWSRIGSRDSFSELGLSSKELDSFLQEWINSNDYNNI